MPPGSATAQSWACQPDAHTPVDAVRALAWGGPAIPVTQAFRDGHTQTWWAADAMPGWREPGGARWWPPPGRPPLPVSTAT